MADITGTEFGNDILNGTVDADRLLGLGGDDQIIGGGGGDTLLGGSGNDVMYGFLGSSGLDPNNLDRADLLQGGDGDDLLRGNAGDDTLEGGAGDDNLRGDGGSDVLDGGEGIDFVSYRFDQLVVNQGVVFDASLVGSANEVQLADGQGGIDTLRSIERLGANGTAFNDVYIGSVLTDQLSGAGGDDQLSGGAGDDVLLGEKGSDRLEGGMGNDYLEAGADSALAQGRSAGVDSLLGGEGDDWLSFSMLAGSDIARMTGGGGADRFQLTGEAARDNFRAAQLDRITDFNQAEGDRLDFYVYQAEQEAGDQPLFGVWRGASAIDFALADGAAAPGADLGYETWQLWTYVSAARNETLVYLDFNQNGLIDGGDWLYALDGQLALSPDSFMEGTFIDAGDAGAGGNDSLVGSDNDDTMVGGAGDDSIASLGGNDAINGGAGNDRIDGGDGNDTLFGGYEIIEPSTRSGSTDTIYGGAGDDRILIRTGDGADRSLIHTGSGADVLRIDLHEPGGSRVAPGLDQVMDFDAVAGDRIEIRVDVAPGALPVELRWGGEHVSDPAQSFGQAAPDGVPQGRELSVWTYFDAQAGRNTLYIDFNRDGLIGEQDFMMQFGGMTAPLSPSDFTPGTLAGVVNGSDGNDAVNGSALADALAGGNGNDTLSGLGDRDTLSGGDGLDSLLGGDGDDLLFGDNGRDTLDGGSGADTMAGGAGADRYYVDHAGDRVVETDVGVDSSNDWIYTNRSFTLSDGVEHGLVSGAGAISLYGNALDNILVAGPGNNTLYGGSGNDTVNYSGANAGVIVSLAVVGAQATGGSGTDTLVLIENLYGSHHADRLTGNGLWNTLNGAGGVDTMEGGDGSDFYYVQQLGDMVIETNADTRIGGSDWVFSYLASYTLGANIENGTLMLDGSANLFGNGLGNELRAGHGDNLINGSGGVDTVSYVKAHSGVSVDLSLTSAQATGGSGSDTLLNIENLTGSFQNDVLKGNTLWNRIDGETGADTMEGGLGSDSYVVDHEGDVVIERADEGSDWVYSRLAGYRLGDHVENGAIDRDDGASMTGNALANVLQVGLGDDTLDGGEGADTASFARASSAVVVELERGLASGGAGTDSLISIENLIGSSHHDSLYGDAQANDIRGGSGSDWIAGGGGNDILRGGGNNKGDGASDSFVFDTAPNGNTNYDRIVAFEGNATDRIVLDPAIYSAIGATLDAGEFRIGTTALDANDHILFDNLTGNLFYDADGSGAGAKVLFAKLINWSGSIDASDFSVLPPNGG
jgi:Ca2+-binding RTX toxin-like protein